MSAVHKADQLETIADDILKDVGEIAVFLFGEDTQKNRCRIYTQASKNISKEKRLPVFRDGKLIKARKSRLRRWISDQEDGLS